MTLEVLDATRLCDSLGGLPDARAWELRKALREVAPIAALESIRTEPPDIDIDFEHERHVDERRLTGDSDVLLDAADAAWDYATVRLRPLGDGKPAERPSVGARPPLVSSSTSSSRPVCSMSALGRRMPRDSLAGASAFL